MIKMWEIIESFDNLPSFAIGVEKFLEFLSPDSHVMLSTYQLWILKILQPILIAFVSYAFACEDIVFFCQL